MNNSEVLITVTADTKDVKRAEKEMQGSFERTQKVAETAFAGAVAAIDAMVGSFVKGGIEYNAQVETYLTRLTTLTGSTKKANDVLNQIKKDALATPFEVSSLTSAESLLLATGMSAEQARGDILALGDALAASGGGNEELSRMAVNLQQIKNVGKATALDIKQFAYAGVDIYGLLADSMGITRAEAADLDVTYEMLSAALQKASQEGGKYYGAMEKQSQTYSGAMSNLQESVQVFKGELTQGLFNAIKGLIPVITDMFNWLTKNKDIVLAIAIPLLTFINILAGMMIVSKIAMGFRILWAVMSANPIGVIIALITAIVAGFIYLWNHCEGFRNFWIGLWEGLKEAFNVFVAVFKLAWEGIKLIFEANIAVIKWVIDQVVSKFNALKTKVKGIADSIVNFFKTLPDKMLKIGTNIVKGLWNGIKNVKEWLLNKVKGFVDGAVKGIKKFFGIKSPSKVMAKEVGQWLPKGIAVGINANTDAVKKSMSNVEREMMSSFQVSPQLANSSALHYSPSVVVNNQINMKQDPLGQMVREVKTFSGGAKNDYNYGMGV